MKKHKLIGVASRFFREGEYHKQIVNDNYLTPLTARGLNTVVLTAANPAITQILPFCDGFLLPGGFNDMSPKHYGQENSGLSLDVEPSIDELDIQILKYAIKNRVPLFGICRGFQLINVVLGGTLNQHIGTDHQEGEHILITQKNSLFDFENQITVNSFHHQAVDKLAGSLMPIAQSKDGFIEAFIHNSLPLFGVQWHPERSAQSAESRMIFDKFAELVKKQ